MTPHPSADPLASLMLASTFDRETTDAVKSFERLSRTNPEEAGAKLIAQLRAANLVLATLADSEGEYVKEIGQIFLKMLSEARKVFEVRKKEGVK